MLWIWAASSLALCGLAFDGEPGHVLGVIAHALGVIAVALVFAAVTGVSLRATIKVDASNRLNIRYVTHTFSDRLENIQAAATPKFNFRRNQRLGLKKLYFGTRLPCFNVGWFALRNGALAFVCVSRKRAARAFRTHDGCYILVDPRVARHIQAAAATSGDARRYSVQAPYRTTQRPTAGMEL